MLSAAPSAFADEAPAAPPRLGRLEAWPLRPCAEAALPDRPLALAEAIDRALCHNPQTREQWANARAQAAQVGVAQAPFLPSLTGNLSASHSRSVGDVDTRSTPKGAALTLSWLLHDFGAREANLENARQLLAAAVATQDTTLQGLLLSTVTAYYQTQATAAAVAAAREAERAGAESVAAAEARYRVGTATPADRLQARTALSQATLARIRAEGDARTARGTLAAVLGIEPQQLPPLAIAPEESLDAAALGNDPEAARQEADLAALVAAAQRQRPETAAAEAQWQAARAAAAAARAAARPTVSLNSTLGAQDVSGLGSRSGSLGVNVSIPLFSGHAPTWRIRAAEAQAEARAAQLERTRLTVAQEVWNAWQGQITARQSLASSADLLAAAEASERVALGRYRAGVGNMLDVLNAQSALAAARRQRVQAAYDWRVARAVLAQALGVLDQELLAPAASAPADGRP